MEKEITFLLNMKLYSLRRSHLESLTLAQLRDALYHTKWLVRVPSRLNEIAKDINDLTFDEVADYLTRQTVFIHEELQETEGGENEEEQF